MHRVRSGDARRLYWTMFVASGVALTLIGPALSELRDRTGSGIGDIGVLFVGQSVGFIAGSLAAGLLLDRFDGHRVYAGAALVMALGQATIPLLRSLPALTAAFVLVGLGAAALSTTSNALIMWRRIDVSRGLNVLHLCFGVGAIIAPLLIRFVAVNAAFWSSAAVVATLGSLALLAPAPEPIRSGRSDQLATTTPIVVLAGVFFALYVALELGFSGWLHTVGLERGLSAASASWLNAGFWIAFTLGRAVVAFPLSSVVPRRVMRVSLGLAAGGGAVLVLGRGHQSSIWVGTVLVGLGAAAQFPTMMAYLDRRIASTGRFTSFVLAAAGVGNLTAPWLIGRSIGAWGPGALMWSALFLALAMSAAFVVVDRILRERHAPPR